MRTASLVYFGETLRGYWARGGKTIMEALSEASGEYKVLMKRCELLDHQLMNKAEFNCREDMDLYETCVAYLLEYGRAAAIRGTSSAPTISPAIWPTISISRPRRSWESPLTPCCWKRWERLLRYKAVL